VAGMFETATKIAIGEIIAKHAKESKFGHILTRESLQELTSDLFDLLLTSRNLKTAGDRMLQGGVPASPRGASKRDPRGGF